MITWALVIIVTIASAFIGFLVHKSPPPSVPIPQRALGLMGVHQVVGGGIRLPLPKWILNVLAGVAMGLVIAGAFWGLHGYLATTDDPVFTSSDTLFLDAGSGRSMTLVFNRSAPLQTSFNVMLRAQQLPPGFQVRSYRATLTAPSDVELVTSRVCAPALKAAASATTLIACDDLSAVRDLIETLWSPIGKKTGTYELTVSAVDFGFPGGDASRYSASLASGGNRTMGTVVNGILQAGDAIVDLDHHEFRFPLTVRTSLGVTQETYDWVALLGAVLGALLGTGWLFKLLQKKNGGGDDGE